MIEQILLIVQWNIVSVNGVRQKRGSVKFIFSFNIISSILLRRMNLWKKSVC